MSMLTKFTQKVKERMGTAEKGDHPMVVEEEAHLASFLGHFAKADKAFAKASKAHKSLSEQYADVTVTDSVEEVKGAVGGRLAALLEALADLNKLSQDQLDALTAKFLATSDQIHSSHEEARREHKDVHSRYSDSRLRVDSLQSELNDLNKKDEKERIKSAAKIKTVEGKLDQAKTAFASVSTETVDELRLLNGGLEADAVEVAVCEYYDQLRDYFQAMSAAFFQLVPTLHEVRRQVQESRERRAAAVAVTKSGGAAEGEVERERMFGMGLEEILRREKSPAGLPLLLSTLVQWLEQNALGVEDLFATAVSPNDLAALKSAVDFLGRPKVDLGPSPNPHCIASLLKMFLRELPDPLTTSKHFEAFIEVNIVKEVAARVEKLRTLVQSLPKAHYTSLEFVLAFLAKVSDKHEKNKMTPGRLATSLAPALIRPASSVGADTTDDARITTADPFELRTVLEFLIEHHRQIFGPADAPVDG